MVFGSSSRKISFVGETVVLDTLRDERKYRTDDESDGFRAEFEDLIFTAPSTQWRDLMETVARRADWYFVQPGGHESLKTVALRKDLWRDEGAGYVRKGPFPPDKTAVVLQQIHRDEATGEATLQVSAKHGDRVHYETGGSTATPSSPVLPANPWKTAELRVSFLAVDTTGTHDIGEPRDWTNTVDVKFQRTYRDGAHRITLKAIPRGTIRYILDAPTHATAASTTVRSRFPMAASCFSPSPRPPVSGRNSFASIFRESLMAEVAAAWSSILRARQSGGIG